MVKNVETASVKREFDRESISLEELFRKFQKKDIDYKIYLVRENRYRENEIFEIVGILGSGRSCYVFLALIDKKLVSLRMSYEMADFKDKFDSVRVEMEDSYDEYFLNILYPSIPIDYLCVGSVKKKNKLFFDRKVYASFWEKADSTLILKMDAPRERKLKWFIEFLKGLRIIHSRNRAHFDIKLDNLFLVDNRLKIGDFEYYLKIEDFINSRIYYCGTPGHIAPEMFYNKKKVTQLIDIFSAGVAFSKFFSSQVPNVEPDPTMEGEIILSEEEENDFNSLFKESLLMKIPTRRIKNAFKFNFKIFNFYRNYLQKELSNPEIQQDLKEIYNILLEMINADPNTRPTADQIIEKLNRFHGKVEEEPVIDSSHIDAAVFKINRTPITIINLNKKNTIEFGSIKRKEHPSDAMSNDINLRFVDISRQHLLLRLKKNPISDSSQTPTSTEDHRDTFKFEICDLNSKHGVFLNSEKIEPSTYRELANGDVIQLGNIISFRFLQFEDTHILRNVTHDKKGGNLLWLDKNQVNEIPERNAVIVLLKKSLSLSQFGAPQNTTITIDEQGNIIYSGNKSNNPVFGDIIL